MYNFLAFIDSLDIREYNKATSFTPAEQAVLISQSKNTPVLEKINALKFLTEHYSDEEFGNNYVVCEYIGEEGKATYRTVVLRTIEIWENILKDRNNNEGVVYNVRFGEREYSHAPLDADDCGLFSCYENAYERLMEKKKEYLDDENLMGVKTYGEIHRIPIDDFSGYISSDVYKFNNEMKLVQVYGAETRMRNGEDSFCLADEFGMFLPLPFKPGDIVKVECPFWKTYYGVFSHEWEKKELLWCNDMIVSLDIWDNERKVFDYTDDSDILGLSYCSDEELPESQKVLKAIRDVRKGKMDFYTMLCYYGPDELKRVI